MAANPNTPNDNIDFSFEIETGFKSAIKKILNKIIVSIKNLGIVIKNLVFVSA